MIRKIKTMSNDRPIGFTRAMLTAVKTSKSLREHTSYRLTSKLDKTGHWVYMSEDGEFRYTDSKGKKAFERGFKGWELALRYLLEDWDGGCTVEKLSKMSERELVCAYSRGDTSPWWYVDPEEDDYV